jgi:LacI family transcriptional regulator
LTKRITIKSIAEDLGISHMTVSRALSNSPKVREDTRKTVLQRAQELGYVKSFAAATMRGEQTTLIGLLLPNLVNEFYARFADSLAQHLEVEGQQLIIHLTGDHIDKEQQALLKLREIQANRVVMVPAPGIYEFQKSCLQDLQIIQLIRQRDMKVAAAAVLVDDSGAIAQAVAHLADRGHRRIAYIGGDSVLSSGHSRLAAFIAGMRMTGLEPEVDLTITKRPSFEMGYRSARDLLDRSRATAIVCGGFEISNGALHACLARGVSLPEDISFVGFGDPSWYRWMGGGISTIRIPVSSLAAKTAELLVQKDNAEKYGGFQHLLSAEFITRRSSLPEKRY